MHRIDIPSMKTFNKLRQIRADACVSIYLPTTPVTSEIAASRIEFSNSVKEALSQAAELIDKRRLAELEEILRDLEEDGVFWRYQARSLAVLATPDQIYTFRLANNLTANVEVADRFQLTPLLRAITFPHTANVVVISENAAQFIEIASDIEPYDVQVPDMPKDLASVVGGNKENRLRGNDGIKVRYIQYCRQIDEALRRYLHHSDVPLIIVGSEGLVSAFRSIYSGSNMIGDVIFGGLDRATPGEIAELARPVLDRYYEREIADLRGEFDRLTSDGRTTTDIAMAARAATFGQIDTLLADMDHVVHGTVDEKTGAVSFGEEGPDTYNIIDEISGRVLANGGRVLAVRRGDIPQQKELAAILRFA